MIVAARPEPAAVPAARLRIRARCRCGCGGFRLYYVLSNGRVVLYGLPPHQLATIEPSGRA